MKTECDYLNGWIRKRSHTQKSHPKVVNPRDIAGERKKKKKKKLLTFAFSSQNSAISLEEWVFVFKVFTTATRKLGVKVLCSAYQELDPGQLALLEGPRVAQLVVCWARCPV